MAFSRYENDQTVRGGKILATNQTLQNIRDGVRNGTLSTTSIVMTETDRLDTLAGSVYGD